MSEYNLCPGVVCYLYYAFYYFEEQWLANMNKYSLHILIRSVVFNMNCVI